MGKKKHKPADKSGSVGHSDRAGDPERDLHKEAIKAVLAEIQVAKSSKEKKSPQTLAADSSASSNRKETHHTEKKHHSGTQRWSLRGLIGGTVIITIAIAFLAANLAASQLTVPAYSRLVNGDRDTWVTFFKAAADRDDGLPLILEYKGRYRELADEINRESMSRRARISYLEAELTQNPEARDILYALALLYHQEGEKEKANDYLNRARAIDPATGKDAPFVKL
ncbi:MAG: hypothetical protein N2691_05800 [Patescibacteria group bacterium]|nr:hypothetical protein [Patescibacteria group bacterium]